MEMYEELLLLRFKGQIFESLEIYNTEHMLEKNISSLVTSMQDNLGIKDLHFFICKSIFDESKYILLENSLEKLTFYDEDYNPEAFNKIDPQFPYDKKIWLKNRKKELKGTVLIQFSEEGWPFSDRFWEELAFILYQYLKKVLEIMFNEYETKKYKKLQYVTNKFHSTMDINSVLKEMLYSLKEIFPSFAYEFLLAYDNIPESGLPISQLDYTMHDSAVMEAFVTGKYILEDHIESKNTYLYFPLSGKQGIYGVLKIIANKSFIIPEQDIEFISILAQNASNAIENAHLYQQSEQLVVDLRLVAKVYQQLNTHQGLADIVSYMVGEMKNSFQAEEIAFVLYQNNHLRVLPGSTSYFFEEESKELLQYLKNHFVKTEEPVFIGNFTSFNGHDYDRFNSIMVEPLKQDSKIIGFVIALHKKSYYFSFNTFKLFQSLTHHTSLAITNTLLREELERLVITDYLTKLYSRKYLDEGLKKSMAKDIRGTFLLIDIDNFKQINDTYGHQVGDEVLIQIAEIIKSNLQRNEIGARWGGEEIAIYLPNRTLEEGLALAKRLVHLTNYMTNPKVTISCGLSYWDENFKEQPLSLFKRADDALYLAKSNGKNQAIANR